MKIANLGLVAGIGLLAAACGSTPQPTERLASAQASIRAAKEIGAQHNPQAQLHAKLAEEQVQKANELIKQGDNERAEYLLRRASADAELAVALAREAQTQHQTEAAESSLAPKEAPSPAPEPAPALRATNQ